MDGIIIIDKPKGYTSREIVDIVGKNYKTRKVGHTGTLDPLATGVLVICVGKATKIVELITSYDKEYIATFKFGKIAPSNDFMSVEQGINSTFSPFSQIFSTIFLIRVDLPVPGPPFITYRRSPLSTSHAL